LESSRKESWLNDPGLQKRNLRGKPEKEPPMVEGENMQPRTTDYLANERTYLAWLRTGITVIALGFVVAKFGLIVRELGGSSQSETSFHFSSIIGIALVVTGGFLCLLALVRFRKNIERIKTERFEPSAGIEALVSSTIFVVSILLIVYLLLTL
jgi:putative membrane protein